MLILNEQDVATLLEFINSQELLAFDVESTGLNVRKDTVVGFGVSSATSGFYVPLYRYDVTSSLLLPYGPGPELVRIILNALSRKKLLMFNASFDTRITKNNLGAALLPSLDTDVMLLKHTCDEDFPLDLKGIGAALYGQDIKEEKKQMQASIKANGGTAQHYYKADVQLLSRYCIADCLLTYRIYNHYRPKLKQEGLDQFFYVDEVMPLLKLVTIPMEEKGVALDMPKLEKAQAEIKQHIEYLEASIQLDIEPLLSTFRAWFLNKDYPLMTWTGKVPAWTKKYATQYGAWRAENAGHMFNLQSKHHLKKLFFDTLKEAPLSRTPTGQPQVDEEFLDSVADKHAWVPKLIEYNKLNKIKSTYIDRLLQESENGRFYPSFFQHRTVSGRMAGDLQQLPRPLEPQEAPEAVVHYTSLIREFIVPSGNNILISADYEQLEPSIFAHTSGDPALQQIFNEGTDFYSTVAIATEKISGVSAQKQAPNYLGKLQKAARQKAKAYSLGIAYGMTGYKLKFEIGCSEAEANQLVENYLAAFPKLREFMNASRNKVRETGEIRTETGRVRHMPQVKTIYEKWGPAIDNDLELWKRYNEVPSLYAQAKVARRTYKNLLNNSINFQVQGLAASIMNRAAIELAKQGLTPVCQVHDELVYDEPSTDCGAIIKQVMEHIMPLSVPLRTTPQFGTNYRLCK